MIVYTFYLTLFAPDSTEQMYNEVPVKYSAMQRLLKGGGQTRQEEKTIIYIINYIIL
jgi:hypothetical protein